VRDLHAEDERQPGRLDRLLAGLADHARVRDDGDVGQVVALGGRQRSLLASLLARAGAVVSVDNLVDLVWPEDPLQDSVAALHNQVSRLRRTIPFTRIETVAPGYRLAVGPDDVDSQRFDRLVRADTAGSLSEALSLWHGAAYAEFAESPVARFEAIRLEEARRQATERWHELRLDEGSPDLPALEAFATEYPLRERTHLVHMRALYASVAELTAVATHAGAPVDLLAMSQAGPVAVALAATRPDLVRRLVFFGTYASAAEVFLRLDLSATLMALVRSHWGLGSKLLADLYRPDPTDAAADHMAAVLRESADRDVAAGYLAAIYAADVKALLPAVSAPALVLHYRGDRVIPNRGGLQLAEGLPDARLVTFEGRYHLPDIRDLDHIVDTITAFLSGPD
jgi:Bacterial transcriptional activator domain/Transcriptional regulatory protein, C terminal/Serine aminopeptidase, S33